MRRYLYLAFGLLAYVSFVGTLLTGIAFVGDFGLRHTIDGGPRATAPGQALLIDCALIALFALQHSGMARRSFKAFTRRCVPEALERSAYVLAASLSLGLLFWQWRPVGWTAWQIDSASAQAALWGAYALGWLIVLLCCFLLSHTHLFGMGPVWAYWQRRPYREPEFRMHLVYRYVRNPQMLGFLICFWAAPTMTFGRLLLASSSVMYILIALRLEQRDLLYQHGDSYAAYCRHTPLLIPRPWRRLAAAPAAD